MPDVEHLKMIQAVIGRLAGNSFLLKGWSVTLAAALSAFARVDSDRSLAWISAGVVVVFAGLDAYYLALERAFRGLYAAAVADGVGVHVIQVGSPGVRRVARTLLSPSVLPLHAAVLVGATVVALST
jgi:hypothetical protein